MMATNYFDEIHKDDICTNDKCDNYGDKLSVAYYGGELQEMWCPQCNEIHFNEEEVE